jgi:oligoribonuclease NrnB/cAMP/cGMP phosphodiesterase (DHH superfamily)
MTQNTKPLVIYHAGCADGVAAAWCFYKEYKDAYEYYPGAYGKPFPDVCDRDVYLVDFSYKRDEMDAICKFASTVTLLDHHASALNDVWPLCFEHSNFNMEHCREDKSGAKIAWDYVKTVSKHKRVLPPVLAYIEDRDLWKFTLPHTREVMAAVFVHDFTLEAYDKLMSYRITKIAQLVQEGTVLLKKFRKDLDSIHKTCNRLIHIDGHLVQMANANGMYASELGSIMAVGQPFSATYYDTQDARKFSLRSVAGGLDVSVIAAKFGGGGHVRAAGFSVPRDHELARY